MALVTKCYLELCPLSHYVPGNANITLPSLFILHGKENLITGRKSNKIPLIFLIIWLFCNFLIFSSIPRFDFKTSCFICGEACNIKKDVRHPDRCEKNPGILCKTADRGFSKDGLRRKSFKEVLLQVRWHC